MPSIPKEAPIFIWFVAGLVTLLLVFYSMRNGEFLKKLSFWGGSAEFESVPKADVVTFRVSYDLPRRHEKPPGRALQGQAVLFVGGSKTKLVVDQASPFATSVVKMEKPRTNSAGGTDEYGYRLEITEIWPPSELITYEYKIEESSEGKLEIKEGDGFKVAITTLIYVQTKEFEQKATISKVLSEKEEQQRAKEEQQRTNEFLDSLDTTKIPNKPYTPKE
jgi:hypothetical protein